LKFKDVLINFNDELVKKVERTKYKDVKSFVLKEDRDKLCNTAILNDTASVSSESSTSSMKSIVLTSKAVDAETSNVKYFNTRKTNLPDVYELYDDMNMIGYPAVPSMHISKTLREIFKNKNIIDTVALQYKFSTKRNKWVLLC
jgi:hypothetical protein